MDSALPLSPRPRTSIAVTERHIAAGIFFTTYEATKTFYSSLLGRLPLSDGLAMPAPLVHSLASGTAELASCLVLTPAEVIKQNAQMLRSEKTTAATTARGGSWRDSTSIRALRMVSQGGGASGAAHRLLTGYTALVARNLPFTAMQFPIFEAVRRRLWERRDRRTEGAGSGDVTVKDGSGSASEGERRIGKGVGMARGLLETGAVNGASAAVSGAIAAVVTTPTDVVKTRMMLSAGEERNVQEQRAPGSAPRGAGEAAAEHGARAHREGAVGRQNMSGMQVARLVYQERGMKGLFRGGLLRAGWTAVGSGLYLGTYEVAKVWLKGTAHEGEKL